MEKQKAILLDRDGTLNEDTGYPHKIKDLQILPGVIDGLKQLQEKFIFIIITNQSGIGRGIFSEEEFHTFNNELIKQLKNEGIEIRKTYYCADHPDDDCNCRKPNPKNVLKAAEEFNIDLKNSWVLGDHASDIELGKNANVKTIYLLTGHGTKHRVQLEEKKLVPDHIAKNFEEATQYILKNSD